MSPPHSFTWRSEGVSGEGGVRLGCGPDSVITTYPVFRSTLQGRYEVSDTVRPSPSTSLRMVNNGMTSDGVSCRGSPRKNLACADVAKGAAHAHCSGGRRAERCGSTLRTGPDQASSRTQSRQQSCSSGWIVSAANSFNRGISEVMLIVQPGLAIDHWGRTLICCDTQRLQ